MKKNLNNVERKGGNKRADVDEFSGEQLGEFSPKFLGMDYFRVVYGAASVLILLMVGVYFTIEDERM